MPAKSIAKSDRPGKFPEVDGVVPAGRGEPAAVGAEFNRGNVLLVSRERDTVRGQRVANQRGSVPDADGVIVAGGRELVAVGTERHVGDVAVVGEDREHLAAGGSV